MPSLNTPPQEPLVLALDTSSSLGSVALARGERILNTLSFESDHGHSQKLLPAVESVLGAGGRDVGEVELFAAVVGPGSFTGLRVALACLRGLAGARPCFGALAPDVAAWAGRGRAGRLLAATDLFHGEVFGGVYDGHGSLVSERESGDLASVMARLQGFLTGDSLAVGSATEKRRVELESLRPGLGFLDLPDGLAPHLASLAAARAGEQTTVHASDLMPFYLRDPMTRGLLNPRSKDK